MTARSVWTGACAAGAMALLAGCLLATAAPTPALAQAIRQAEPGEVIYLRPPTRGQRQPPPQVVVPPQSGFRIPFLERLFGGGPREVYVPPQPRGAVGRPVQGGSQRASGAAAAAAVQAPKPVVEPKYFVAVVGDEFASAAADGLEEALSDRPDIAVIRKTDDNRGLAMGGEPGLPGAIRSMLAADPKISAVVMAVGEQDQRPMTDARAEVPFRSARWNQLYATRIDEVLIALTERRLPVIWLGLPPVEDAASSVGNAHINELLRQRLIGFGASFHDVWDGFVDESEAFAVSGPGLDGRNTRLRLQDGVGFTKTGARKYAHYAEIEIRRLFPIDKVGAAVAETPEDVSIHVLTSAPRTPGATLLDAGLPARPRVPEAVSAAVPQGRADDFRWSDH